MSEEWYTVTPYYTENRGNLKICGLEAKTKFTNIDKFLIVHIKEDLALKDVQDLNDRFRTYFGDDTLVFCVNTNIDFIKLRKLKNDEVKELGKFPVISKVEKVGDQDGTLR